MNVIFVIHQDFSSPSGMHVFHLANELEKLGVRCATYSPGWAETVSRYGKPLFRAFDTRVQPQDFLAETAFPEGETIIHCWTPRETPRLLVEKLTASYAAPVIVHMEDNEEAITEAHLEDLSAGERESESLWRPGSHYFSLSHPARHREFLAAADGYTCIIESLLDFKPDAVPGHVFWPSCEPEVFDIPLASSAEEKKRWDIGPDEKVVFYPGNLHPNNADEVIQLYAAIAHLRARGLPIRIIKFGQYSPAVMRMFGEIPGLSGAIVDLTERIAPKDVPTVMRAADVLVQPGRDDAFNRYRFPSKLPLFMASGRPVILPKSNLGEHLTHGENCLLLRDADSCSEEIAAHILDLAGNPEKAAAIGTAGREFARRHFSWKASAEGLKTFYETILAARREGHPS